MSYATASQYIVAHLASAPEFARVAELFPAVAEEALLREIIGAAGALAEGVLEPFDKQADRQGCRLEDERVRVADGHHEAWQAFTEGGWTAIDGAEDFGGMGLPLAVHSGCEELFNRASPAFGMLPTPIRCASRVLERYAGDAIKEEWLPRLLAGEWGATICISEADAGSDVSRLRTLAVLQADGTWSLTGEKMWISFGDHELTPRIGHMVLARTPDAPAGSAGLSLFLVPSTVDGERNSIAVRRVEEKLGLHGSPTCALVFEDARGKLIGQINRGLPQLFTMIIGMRLSVASQGAGIAGAAADLAMRYAAERRQGGPPDAPPTPINTHGDVRRMLLEMSARAEVARGLVLTASLMSDLQARETDDDARAEAGELLAWLLPITKNFCAEAAFSCASDAIQVLGGAGYTIEWPAERYLRDARVLSIYEGTSGMQALDLVMRRVFGDAGKSMAVFVTKVRGEIAAAADREAAGQLAAIVDLLVAAGEGLKKLQAGSVAYPFLQLAALASTGWIALRLANSRSDLRGGRMAALGRQWLMLAGPQARAQAELVALGSDLTANFLKIETEDGV